MSSRRYQLAFNCLKNLKTILSKQNATPVCLSNIRRYTDASSISDRALFPGYKGEFNTNLEFIYPENTAQIECYRVMSRKGIVLDPASDPGVNS